MDAISLFSGAGGLDIGVRQAGFNVKACVELDVNACQTLRSAVERENLQTTVYEGDIKQFDPLEILKAAKKKPGLMKISVVATLVLAGVSAVADFRPPSVPIVSCDPFFSIWSGANAPTDDDTSIWYGGRQPIRIWIELDGVRYRLMGAKAELPGRDRGGDVPALRCTDVEVRPLTSVYEFTDGKAKVKLSFMTPKFTDELDVFSRPVTYASVRTKGAKSVKVFAEIGSELATNDDRAPMVTNRFTVAGLDAVKIGRKDQKTLSMKGDCVRCNWGYACVVNPVAEGSRVRFLLAYDDVDTVQFLGETLQAWWKRGGKTFEQMLAEAVRDGDRLIEKAEDFDSEFADDMKRVGGEKYRDLTSLAYRHSFAACKLVAAKDGRPLYFSKENTSNGCMGTVDVFYPQLPLLLLTSKTLSRATLEPIMLYASSGKWPYKYAPHDVGTYPLGNGQAYNMEPDKNGQPKPDAARMPVEECGNMLVSVYALADAEGNAAFAETYWPVLTDWVAYLEQFGFDPGNQLCTDDFAGHLAHNANLSLKSIMAFASYARLAALLKKGDLAAKYRNLAEESVPKWMKAAEGGAAGGYRLAFDQPGTWSMKYNLVWDRILGFRLFPAEVAEREMAAYRQVAQPFGLALDSRKTYTKTDWEFWSAALTGKRADLDFITGLVWRYANETPDRNPFPDWYWANNARVRGFLGRSVIGGIFMPVLGEKDIVSKWRRK